MTGQPFRELFCRHFSCSPSDYEERAFRELLYRHGMLVAPLVRKMSSHFFDEDFKFIRYLGEATDLREAKAHAADFQDAYLARRSFARITLKIRVSGRKATRLAQRLF